MISLNRPGNSLLHRMPAGPKLLALMVAIALISVLGTNPFEAVIALLVTYSLYVLAFPNIANVKDAGPILFFKQLWSLKWLLILVTGPQLLFGAKLAPVLINALRLTDAIVLATLFTLTTPNADLMLVIERALRPLKHLGIKPATVSLTLAMTINAIPMISKFLSQTKEAQQARGIRPTAVLITVPLLVASLKYADEFAEALTARGVEV